MSNSVLFFCNGLIMRFLFWEKPGAGIGSPVHGGRYREKLFHMIYNRKKEISEMIV